MHSPDVSSLHDEVLTPSTLSLCLAVVVWVWNVERVGMVRVLKVKSVAIVKKKTDGKKKRKRSKQKWFQGRKKKR